FRDVARAVVLARKAVAQAKDHAPYRTLLGVALYRAGDWQAAAEALRQAQELGKGVEPGTWLVLAMARWRLGERDEAQRLYDQAVARMDQNAGWQKDRTQRDVLRGLRAEAAELLGVRKKD